MPLIRAPIHNNVPRIFLRGHSCRGWKVGLSYFPGFDFGLGFRVSSCDLGVLWEKVCQLSPPLKALCEESHQPTHPDNPGLLKTLKDDLPAEDTQNLEDTQRHSEHSNNARSQAPLKTHSAPEDTQGHSSR